MSEKIWENILSFDFSVMTPDELYPLANMINQCPEENSRVFMSSQITSMVNSMDHKIMDKGTRDYFTLTSFNELMMYVESRHKGLNHIGALKQMGYA